MVGYPSDKVFRNVVNFGMIPKCLVTLDDIKNYNTIFIPDVSSLKGKMMRRQPNLVVSNYTKAQKDILQLHNTVSVVVDIMFVNGMTFLVSISIHVKFTMFQFIGKRMIDNKYKYL